MTHDHPVPDPIARLTAAVTHLRTLLAAIATESPADLPLHADGRTVTQGRFGLHDFATAETPEVAAFIAALGPLAGEPIAAVLDQAAGRIRALRKAAERIWDGSDDKDGLEAFMAEGLKKIAPALALADAILAREQPHA